MSVDVKHIHTLMPLECAPPALERSVIALSRLFRSVRASLATLFSTSRTSEFPEYLDFPKSGIARRYQRKGVWMRGSGIKKTMGYRGYMAGTILYRLAEVDMVDVDV